MRYLLVSLVIIGGTVATLGCGGSAHSTPADAGNPDQGVPMPEVDGGPDGTPAPDPDAGAVTAEQACDAYLDAYCKLSETCSPYIIHWLDGTVAACKANYMVGCVAG